MSETERYDGDPFERLRDDIEALAFVEELLLPGTESKLRAALPLPEDLEHTPIILDTDIGGDPDDAITVVAAARTCPQLALVLTTDETASGGRARFARWLLDELGRAEVAVAAGARLTAASYYCVEGLVPGSVGEQPGDVLGAVQAVCAATQDPVRWVGLGPLTNLAKVLERDPDLAQQLRLTQMGGTLQHPDAQHAEHNVALDVAAAQAVLRAVAHQRLTIPEFVSTDVTVHGDTAVTSASSLYQRLTASGSPLWAQILAQHLDRWFERFHPQTHQHDPLTLTAALDLPFVESHKIRVMIDDTGRIRRDDGVPVWWSFQARYELFMPWLSRVIDPATEVAVSP